MRKHVLLFLTEEKIFFITKIERSGVEYKSLIFPSTDDIENIEDSIRINHPKIIIIDNKLSDKLKEDIIYSANKLISDSIINMRVCIIGGKATEIPGISWVSDMEHARDLIKTL